MNSTDGTEGAPTKPQQPRIDAAVPMQPMNPIASAPPAASISRTVKIPHSNEEILLNRIFPSPTNNLQFKPYTNPNSANGSNPNNQPPKFLHCLNIDNTIKHLQYILASMCILHIITIFIVFGEIVGYVNYFEFYILLMILAMLSPLLMLLSFKCYAFWQCKQFIAKSHIDGVFYHMHGIRIYYAIIGDIGITFLFIFFWTFFAFDEYFIDEFIHFEELLYSTITWLVAFPGWCYVITMIYVIHSELPKYYEHYSYAQYTMRGNDAKYCLYYGYSTESDKIYWKQCLCNCSDERGGIRGISIWCIIVGILSMIEAATVLGYIFYYYVYFLLFFYSLVIGLLHVLGGYYGIKICNNTVTSGTEIRLSEYMDYEAFGSLVSKAISVYTVLSYVYGVFYAFGVLYYLTMMAVYLAWAGDSGWVLYYLIYLAIMVGLGGFITYLPYHCKTLIPSLCENVNLTYDPSSHIVINGRLMKVVSRVSLPASSVQMVPAASVNAVEVNGNGSGVQGANSNSNQVESNGNGNVNGNGNNNVGGDGEQASQIVYSNQ